PHLPDGAVLAVEHLVALRPQVADGVVPELPQAVGHLRDARRPGRAGTRRDAGVRARTALARTTGREAVEGESGVLGDSASLDDVVRTRGPLVRGGGLVERRESDPSRDREAGDDDHAQESGDERMPPTIRGAIRPVLDRCGFHCALLASARPFPVAMTVAPRKWRSRRIAGFPGVSRNRLPERRPFYRRAAFPSENFRFTGLELYTRTADRTPSRGPRRPPAHAVRALRSVGERSRRNPSEEHADARHPVRDRPPAPRAPPAPEPHARLPRRSPRPRDPRRPRSPPLPLGAGPVRR